MPEHPLLEAHVEAAGGEPAGLLVLVHGFDQTETHMAVAGRLVDPRRRFALAAPRGPIELPTRKSRAWVLPRRRRPEQFGVSLRLLAAFVDAQCEAHGVAGDRVVLGGFSQGAILALALAALPGRAIPAGFIAWCGAVPEGRGVDVDITRLRGVPVLVHGATDDDVVPIDVVRAGADELRSAGAVVRVREYDAPHEVTLDMLVDARSWLARLGSGELV